jgi:hypothetical protein
MSSTLYSSLLCTIHQSYMLLVRAVQLAVCLRYTSCDRIDGVLVALAAKQQQRQQCIVHVLHTTAK